MYQLFGVLYTTILMLSLGCATLIAAVLFSQRILTMELAKRKEVLDGIAHNCRLRAKLESSVCRRWRIYVASFGVASLFLPIYTVFGNFLRGG